jgi:hypothetical protein
MTGREIFFWEASAVSLEKIGKMQCERQAASIRRRRRQRIELR